MALRVSSVDRPKTNVKEKEKAARTNDRCIEPGWASLLVHLERFIDDLALPANALSASDSDLTRGVIAYPERFNLYPKMQMAHDLQEIRNYLTANPHTTPIDARNSISQNTQPAKAQWLWRMCVFAVPFGKQDLKGIKGINLKMIPLIPLTSIRVQSAESVWNKHQSR